MRANPLLAAVAVTYGIVGLSLTFAADEVLGRMGIASSPEVTWMAQMLGAALFALAFLNWFLRFTAMGGIQGRALLVTNMSFLVVAFFATSASGKRTGDRCSATTAVIRACSGRCSPSACSPSRRTHLQARTRRSPTAGCPSRGQVLKNAAMKDVTPSSAARAARGRGPCTSPSPILVRYVYGCS